MWSTLAATKLRNFVARVNGSVISRNLEPVFGVLWPDKFTSSSLRRRATLSTRSSLNSIFSHFVFCQPVCLGWEGGLEIKSGLVA